MNRTTPIILLACVLGIIHIAVAEDMDPPSEITISSYIAWLRGIDSKISPFTVFIFDWYNEQQSNPLPLAVNLDPEHVYVSVDRAVKETIELEDHAQIQVGSTFGFEAYGIVEVPIELALEAALFQCGKPVGKAEGNVSRSDPIFSSSRASFQRRWADKGYLFSISRRGGGPVQDVNDDYTVLVRGNAKDGYALFSEFFRPTAGFTTATKTYVSVLILKPQPTGNTEFRQSMRYNGQKYDMFGIDFGRKTIGFNLERIREEVKIFLTSTQELRNTGTIK